MSTEKAIDSLSESLIRTHLSPEAGFGRLPNLYFRNIVLPWNVVRAWLADTLQWLRRRSGIFPEIKVFQDAPYDKRLLDEADDFHLSSALRAFQGINIPYFLQKHSPQMSSPSGVCDHSLCKQHFENKTGEELFNLLDIYGVYFRHGVAIAFPVPAGVSNQCVDMGVPVDHAAEGLMVHYCTGRLIEILKLELRLEISDYTGRLHWLTLEQIFIENRLYKNIEECTSWDNVRDAVIQSLKPFTDEINLEVTEKDIDKLLSLKIRRISRFDIDSHKEEMGIIRKKMKKAKSNLRNIVPFAINYLEKLLEKYGKNYPRLTSIEDFSDIDVKKVAIRNLKAGFNSDTGLFGNLD